MKLFLYLAGALLLSLLAKVVRADFQIVTVAGSGSGSFTGDGTVTSITENLLKPFGVWVTGNTLVLSYYLLFLFVLVLAF